MLQVIIQYKHSFIEYITQYLLYITFYLLSVILWQVSYPCGACQLWVPNAEKVLSASRRQEQTG